MVPVTVPQTIIMLLNKLMLYREGKSGKKEAQDEPLKMKKEVVMPLQLTS